MSPPCSIIVRMLVVIATAAQARLPPGDAGKQLSPAIPALVRAFGSPRAVGSHLGDNREARSKSPPPELSFTTRSDRPGFECWF